VLALAVAAELERAGRSVAFLGLVDPPLPGHSSTELAQPTLDRVTEYFTQLGAEPGDARIAALGRAERARLEAELAAAPDDAARLAMALEFAQARGLISKNLSLGVCQWRLETLEQAAALVAAHAAQPVAADLHLWLSQSNAASAAERARAFSAFTRGRVLPETVPASHAEIVHDTTCLEAIGRALVTALPPDGKARDNPTR